MHSAAGVLKDPPVVNWKDLSSPIPRDRNTFRMPPRTTTPVRNCTGPSFPPIIVRSHKIEDPRRNIIPQEIRNAEPIDPCINITPVEHRNPTPSCSKIIDSKTFTTKSDDVSAGVRMKFRSDNVLSVSRNFMDLGMSFVDTTNEIWSVFASTTRIISSSYVYDWLPRSHFISKATEDIVIETKAKNHYNFKSEFENSRDKVVDQYFGRKHNSTSRPPLDSTPIGTNTTNRTTLPSDSIQFGTKFPKPTSPALPKDLPKEPDPDPSLSDSSRKSNSLNDRYSSKPKKNKRDKKKKRWKYNKEDS